MFSVLHMFILHFVFIYILKSCFLSSCRYVNYGLIWLRGDEMNINSIITKNLLMYMDRYNYKDYKSFSKAICINTNTFKCWISEKRNPTINTLDKICDKLELPTYYLFIPPKNFIVDQNIGNNYLPNNSRKIISTNLKKIFISKHKYTWNDKASLFYGYFSIDTLMSYTRDQSFRTPPLDKISLLAECLGIESYKLIMKGVEFK